MLRMVDLDQNLEIHSHKTSINIYPVICLIHSREGLEDAGILHLSRSYTDLGHIRRPNMNSSSIQVGVIAT